MVNKKMQEINRQKYICCPNCRYIISEFVKKEGYLCGKCRKVNVTSFIPVETLITSELINLKKYKAFLFRGKLS